MHNLGGRTSQKHLGHHTHTHTWHKYGAELPRNTLFLLLLKTMHFDYKTDCELILLLKSLSTNQREAENSLPLLWLGDRLDANYSQDLSQNAWFTKDQKHGIPLCIISNVLKLGAAVRHWGWWCDLLTRAPLLSLSLGPPFMVKNIKVCENEEFEFFPPQCTTFC